MAVIATAQVTLAVTVDVQKVDTFYCLTNIGASQPSIDTSSATPSGWSATEPEYDSSKQLWTCQKTTLTDSTFYWGAVSKSSSYSGANSAYNRATSAMEAADSAIVSATPIYYRSQFSATPNAPASDASIGDNPDASEAWEHVMPNPMRDRYFFTCNREEHVDGSVTFSEVRSLDNATFIAQWCAAADNPYIDGGKIYANSVTADKLAASSVTAEKVASGAVTTDKLDAGAVTADKLAVGAITVGALGRDVTDKLDGMEQGIADAAGLVYDHTWTLADGTYAFEAHAWRGGVEITDELPGEFFTWVLRTESGDAQLASGATLSVAASAAGYRASVVGGLQDSVDYALASSAGDAIVDSDGNALIARWVA